MPGREHGCIGAGRALPLPVCLGVVAGVVEVSGGGGGSQGGEGGSGSSASKPGKAFILIVEAL